MRKPIRRVAVIGAGVMGSGIAAHVANAGIPVRLLDIVPEGAEGPKARDAVALGALKKLAKAKPAPLFSKAQAGLISVGNIEDHLEELAGYDLVIEAIIERVDIKQALFARLDAALGPDTLVASNTSGLRISELMEGRSERFRQNFMVMHFFNPPRYMKLLELVRGEDTADATVAAIETFGREALGKGIVHAKDVPNFVANRIGCYGLMATMHLMVEEGLAPEDADLITGVAMARPKSATYRTADVVGIDTLGHVAHNCYTNLVDDEEREVFKLPAYVEQMIAAGQLGDKSRGGFYKKSKAGRETLDPSTGAYRAWAQSDEIKAATKAATKAGDAAARVRALVASDGPAGAFAWKVLSRTLAYSARRLGEISDAVEAIDAGMRWGYNWELGPFQLWDALGFEATCARMVEDGVALPACVTQMREAGVSGFYQGDEVYDPLKGAWRALDLDPREASFEALRQGDAPAFANGGLEAWDLGDGVLGVRFITKANSIDTEVIAGLHAVVDLAEREFEALLLTNEGDNFCVGANLFMVLQAAKEERWDEISSLVEGFQGAVQRLKYATVPVVVAPFGMTLGGGLELCLAADAVQGAAETYSGLVEVGVGLIPGGAGTLNLLWRALEGVPDGVEVDTYALVTQVFKNIALAKVATSFDEGKAFGYFRGADGVSFDRARQLVEAKARAVGLARSGYHPPVPRSYRLPGASGIATLEMLVQTLQAGGFASEHDALISMKVATVLCGGPGGASREVSEGEILALERQAFVDLCKEPKSQERMEAMLKTNKPLRN